MDTGGGFLLDQETMAAASQGSPVKTVQMPSEHSTCDSCGKAFLLSFLLENFALEVCDNCRCVRASGQALLLAMSCFGGSHGSHL